jgi:hypothetical protein
MDYPAYEIELKKPLPREAWPTEEGDPVHEISVKDRLPRSHDIKNLLKDGTFPDFATPPDKETRRRLAWRF